MGYALAWWNQLVVSRRHYEEEAISTWQEMKTIMRKRFMPRYYYRHLYNNFQAHKKGSRSVEGIEVVK